MKVTAKQTKNDNCLNDCLHFVVANVENRQKAYDFACYHKIKQRPQHA